ncbi:hypothetical protein ITJ42_07595 [Clavibacter michiganensis subsp. phaseoli]|uniref:Uncharacterized protein n=1 Tax=Clavibacter phaseoli TaxID=1734031 RepID=A0A8I0SCZ1_9MICO|nr:hypothetical protein [Clavibacter phaseoli]MBF4631075.1 hypothetical protein [Clavibacter phaseoli]
MRTSRRAMWTVVAVGLLVVGALAIGTWSGTCVDYVAIPRECTVGPALGWPGAVLTAAVCAAGALVCLRRAARRDAPASPPTSPSPSASAGDDADLRGPRS